MQDAIRVQALKPGGRAVKTSVCVGERLEIDESVSARHDEEIALERTEDVLRMVVKIPQQIPQRDLEWELVPAHVSALREGPPVQRSSAAASRVRRG